MDDGSADVHTCCDVVCRCRLYADAAYTHRDSTQLLACRLVFDEATDDFDDVGPLLVHANALYEVSSWL